MTYFLEIHSNDSHVLKVLFERFSVRFINVSKILSNQLAAGGSGCFSVQIFYSRNVLYSWALNI